MNTMALRSWALSKATWEVAFLKMSGKVRALARVSNGEASTGPAYATDELRTAKRAKSWILADDENMEMDVMRSDEEWGGMLLVPLRWTPYL